MKCMKHIVATPAPKLHRPHMYPLVVAFAALVAVVTTGLLFEIDKIIDYIYAAGVGGVGATAVLATATAGVFALPYLLRMKVSPLMRVASCIALLTTVCGWLLGAWWLEVNTSAWYSEVAVVGAYVSILACVLSVYVVGLPIESLKKKR